MRQRDRRRYLACIGNRDWLRLEEGGIYGIPERLQEIDPDLFFVFNRKTGEFEVHDAAVPVKGLTRVLTAPEADARILSRVRAASHNWDPIGAAEDWATAEKQSIDRQFARDRDAVAHDLADAYVRADFGQTRFAAAKPS